MFNYLLLLFRSQSHNFSSVHVSKTNLLAVLVSASGIKFSMTHHRRLNSWLSKASTRVFLISHHFLCREYTLSKVASTYKNKGVSFTAKCVINLPAVHVVTSLLRLK